MAADDDSIRLSSRGSWFKNEKRDGLSFRGSWFRNDKRDEKSLFESGRHSALQFITRITDISGIIGEAKSLRPAEEAALLLECSKFGYQLNLNNLSSRSKICFQLRRKCRFGFRLMAWGLVLLQIFERPTWTLTFSDNSWQDTDQYPSYSMPFMSFQLSTVLKTTMCVGLWVAVGLESAFQSRWRENVFLFALAAALALKSIALILAFAAIAVNKPPSFSSSPVEAVIVLLIEQSFQNHILSISKAIPTFALLITVLAVLVCVYTSLGYFIFSPTSEEYNEYFYSFGVGVWNMLMVLCGSNWPSPMIPAYNQSSAYSIYFFAYIIILGWGLLNIISGFVFALFKIEEGNTTDRVQRKENELVSQAFTVLDTQQKGFLNYKELDRLLVEWYTYYHAPNSGDIPNAEERYQLTMELDQTHNGIVELTEFLFVYDKCLGRSLRNLRANKMRFNRYLRSAKKIWNSKLSKFISNPKDSQLLSTYSKFVDGTKKKRRSDPVTILNSVGPDTSMFMLRHFLLGQQHLADRAVDLAQKEEHGREEDAAQDRQSNVSESEESEYIINKGGKRFTPRKAFRSIDERSSSRSQSGEHVDTLRNTMSALDVGSMGSNVGSQHGGRTVWDRLCCATFWFPLLDELRYWATTTIWFIDTKQFDLIADTFICFVSIMYLCLTKSPYITNDVQNDDSHTKRVEDAWVVAIIFFMILENLVKALVKGPYRFSRSYRNCIDFSLTTAMVLLLIFREDIHESQHYIDSIAFRAMVIVRILLYPRNLLASALFRNFRKRNRFAIETASKSANYFTFLFILLFIMIYCFASLGVQIFGGVIVKTGATGERISSSSYGASGYWPLNFNDLPSGMATMFILLSVNNMHVTTSGFVAATSQWAEVFFAAWYCIGVLLLLNVITAAFLSRFTGYLEKLRELNENYDEVLKTFALDEDPFSPIKNRHSSQMDNALREEYELYRASANRPSVTEELKDNRESNPNEVIANPWANDSFDPTQMFASSHTDRFSVPYIFQIDSKRTISYNDTHTLRVSLPGNVTPLATSVKSTVQPEPSSAISPKSRYVSSIFASSSGRKQLDARVAMFYDRSKSIRAQHADSYQSETTPESLAKQRADEAIQALLDGSQHSNNSPNNSAGTTFQPQSPVVAAKKGQESLLTKMLKSQNAPLKPEHEAFSLASHEEDLDRLREVSNTLSNSELDADIIVDINHLRRSDHLRGNAKSEPPKASVFEKGKDAVTNLIHRIRNPDKTSATSSGNLKKPVSAKQQQQPIKPSANESIVSALHSSRRTSAITSDTQNETDLSKSTHDKEIDLHEENIRNAIDARQKTDCKDRKERNNSVLSAKHLSSLMSWMYDQEDEEDGLPTNKISVYEKAAVLIQFARDGEDKTIFHGRFALNCYKLRSKYTRVFQVVSFALCIMRFFERPLWTYRTPDWNNAALYPNSGVPQIDPYLDIAIKVPLLTILLIGFSLEFGYKESNSLLDAIQWGVIRTKWMSIPFPIIESSSRIFRYILATLIIMKIGALLYCAGSQQNLNIVAICTFGSLLNLLWFNRRSFNKLRYIVGILPKVIVVLLVFLVVVLFFAAMGPFVFEIRDIGNGSDDDANTEYFGSYPSSVWSVFVAITSSSYPNQIMPAYTKYRAVFIFVFLLICVGAIIMLNVIVMVVLIEFQRALQFAADTQKAYRDILLIRAYEILDHDLKGYIEISLIDQLLDELYSNYSDFQKAGIPRGAARNILINILDVDGDGKISLDDFLNFMDVMRIKISLDTKYTFLETLFPQTASSEWFKRMKTIVTSKYFDSSMDLLATFLIVLGLSFDANHLYNPSPRTFRTTLALIIFLNIEMLVKLIVRGALNYFRSFRNRTDFLLSLLLTVFVILELSFDPNDVQSYDGSGNNAYIVLLRVCQICRLILLTRNIHQLLFNYSGPTINRLLMRIFMKVYTIGIIFFCAGFMFASIGVYNFGGLITLDESNSNYEQLSTSTYGVNDFYGLNFNDFTSAFVTLFVCLHVSDFDVITDGFVSVTSSSAKLFFTAWYVMGVLLLLNILKSFFLGEFLLFFVTNSQKIKQQESEHQADVTPPMNSPPMRDEADPLDPTLPAHWTHSQTSSVRSSFSLNPFDKSPRRHPSFATDSSHHSFLQRSNSTTQMLKSRLIQSMNNLLALDQVMDGMGEADPVDREHQKAAEPYDPPVVIGPTMVQKESTVHKQNRSNDDMMNSQGWQFRANTEYVKSDAKDLLEARIQNLFSTKNVESSHTK